MPMVAAAIVTLYLVRILKPPLGNALGTTSHECRPGVISELLRGAQNKRPPGAFQPAHRPATYTQQPTTH